MSISRRRPPIVRQTHADSCWAAVLESWSIADGHIPRQHQQALINQWGEGGTGGITPLTKIPSSPPRSACSGADSRRRAS